MIDQSPRPMNLWRRQLGHLPTSIAEMSHLRELRATDTAVMSLLDWIADRSPLG